MTELVNDIRRVVILDDDEFALELMTEGLRQHGFEEIVCCSRGDVALEHVAMSAVDAVICDLQMPEMDGPKFLRHLADASFMGPVVLISGERHRILKIAENLGKEHRLNIVGAFPKPVSGLALAEVLRKYQPQNSPATIARKAPIVLPDQLYQALENGEFIVHYQPKVRCEDGVLVGVEALVRWQHPTLGLLPPFVFLPVAEANGLMAKLTECVLEQACTQLARWRASEMDIHLAANVDVDTLTRLDLPELVKRLAQERGLSPAEITLEVTEGSMVGNMKATLETLARLSLMGVPLSIDDFGTGYATLEQLGRMPFSEMKIDRTFVHGSSLNKESHAIVMASVELAKQLEMSVVAEGVEDLEDWQSVQSIGCDLVQGYFVSKPLPGEQLLDWATEWEFRRPSLSARR